MHALEQRTGLFEIGAPDIAAIDHTQRQHFVARIIRHERVELVRRAAQVEMEAGDRKRF